MGVKGIVTDEKGNPVSGAKIVVAKSDEDGEVEIIKHSVTTSKICLNF